jgi:hypothetical protein
MAQTLPDSPALRQVQAALDAGDLYLVNEAAQHVAFMDTLDQPCWAHMRAGADGQFYVQQLRGSRSLLRSSYLAILDGTV